MSKCDYFFGIGGDCVPFNTHYHLYENECVKKRENLYTGDDYYSAKNYLSNEDYYDENNYGLIHEDYEGECSGDCFESNNQNIWMSVTFGQILEMAFEDVADKIFSGEIQ